jgi:hypothetical protein
VQVGAADAAGANREQDLAGARLGVGQLGRPQRLNGSLEIIARIAQAERSRRSKSRAPNAARAHAAKVTPQKAIGSIPLLDRIAVVLEDGGVTLPVEARIEFPIRSATYIATRTRRRRR